MRSILIVAAVGVCLSAVIGGCSLFKSISQPAPAPSPRVDNPDIANRPSVVPTNLPGRSDPAFGDSSTDQVHTPPKGSPERQAIMDALREEYNDRRSPVYQPHRGDVTFVVNYLKVHSGWAWAFADPHSSDPADSFGENNGFLLHEENSKWKIMTLPPIVDDPDDPENMDYPSRKDVEKIRQKYPPVPKDIFPSAAA